MKIIANSIMEHCKEQGLSFAEARLLLKMVDARIENEVYQATEEVLKRGMDFTPF